MIARSVLLWTAGVALLSSCSGRGFATTNSLLSSVGESRSASAIPPELHPPEMMNLRGINAPDAATGGLYVSEFLGTSIFGYKYKNDRNRKPRCTVPFASGVTNDIAVDRMGNLIVPNGQANTVTVGRGPQMCGPELGSFSDPYGVPADAASNNAATGKILVANINDNSGNPGSISVCMLAAGCTSNLTNAAMNEVPAVALDRSGNCWASGHDIRGVTTLTYFAGCAGSGIQATGYKNSSYGGLDVDKDGNLVSIDAFFNGTGQVFVYKGCKPNCTLVGGPFPLHGEAVYGKLGHLSRRFATGDFALGQVDVYSYSPTKISYLYSFNNGLTGSQMVEGVAYNPSVER